MSKPWRPRIRDDLAGSLRFPRGRLIGAPRARLLVSALLVAACATATPVGIATGPPAATVDLAAADLAFDQTSLELPADVVVALTFDNRDPGILHNVAIYRAAGSEAVFRGETFAGIATRTFLLGPLALGTYRFTCDVHPTMSGTVSVAP